VCLSEGHGSTLRGKSRLPHSILGGAAVHRCDDRLFSIPALAAEVRAVRPYPITITASILSTSASEDS